MSDGIAETAPFGDVITLNAGGLTCVIAPDVGCAIARFASTGGRFGTFDWFRRASVEPQEPVRALDMSCFPLVPYSGRIAGGRLTTPHGQETLPTGLTGDPNALHGVGWIRAWSMEEVQPRRARFGLAGNDREWPFAFEATQTFELAEDALHVSLALRNADRRTMPAGIGLHPYFAGTGITLFADYDTLWQTDTAKLFERKSAVPPRWNAAAGMDLAGSELEHGFSGWNGRATLRWPDRPARLAIEASDMLRHLVLYTRPYGADGAGFCCVEPVSHSVDAFNLAAKGVADTGTVLLAPDEVLAGTVSFTLIANS